MHNKKAVIISQSHIFIENKLLALNLEKISKLYYGLSKVM